MAKSPDAFRTISEVAEWLDRPAHVLRFWESKFTQVKPVKRAGGRRYYRPQDMLLLGGIKRLLHDDGMTIKGVQKMLRENGVQHVTAMSQPLDTDIDAAEPHQLDRPDLPVSKSIPAPSAPVSAPVVSSPQTSPVTDTGPAASSDNLVSFPRRSDPEPVAVDAKSDANSAAKAGETLENFAPQDEAGFAQDVEPDDEPSQTSLFDFATAVPGDKPQPAPAKPMGSDTQPDTTNSAPDSTATDASAMSDQNDTAAAVLPAETAPSVADGTAAATPPAPADGHSTAATAPGDGHAVSSEAGEQVVTASPQHEKANTGPRIVDVADDILVTPRPGPLSAVLDRRQPLAAASRDAGIELVSRLRTHSRSLKAAAKKA